MCWFYRTNVVGHVDDEFVIIPGLPSGLISLIVLICIVVTIVIFFLV